MGYELDRSLLPPSFLPEGLDRSSLIDITSIGNEWRVYMDTSTGTIHDSKIYYEQYLRETNV